MYRLDHASELSHPSLEQDVPRRFSIFLLKSKIKCLDEINVFEREICMRNVFKSSKFIKKH